MMCRRKLFCLTAAVVFAAAAAVAQNPKKPVVKRVYMFGFAASFTDSVACQTALQQVDSAWVDAHGMLVDRSLYSIQLQSFLEQNKGVKNPVCTVFFGKKERRMQKLWQKVKRRYDAAQELILQTLTPEDFTFQAEEYRPILIGDEALAPEDGGQEKAAPPAENPKKKNNKKK